MGKDGVEWISSSCRAYLMNAKRHSFTRHCITVNGAENVDLKEPCLLLGLWRLEITMNMAYFHLIA